jgi:maltose-binding protein MalE
MSSAPSQVAIAEANHTLPTRKSAQNAISGEIFISKFLHLASTAVAQPVIPQVGNMFDSFNPNIAAALDGSESPTAALNAVADAWKQLLASS